MRLNNLVRIAALVILVVTVGFAPSAQSAKVKIVPGPTDNSGRDCSSKHGILVYLNGIQGLHFGKTKYIDVQLPLPRNEGPLMASAKVKKTAPKPVVLCRMVIRIFDRFEGGLPVNPVYRTYYPRRPGLGVRHRVEVPDDSGRGNVDVWVYARLKR